MKKKQTNKRNILKGDKMDMECSCVRCNETITIESPFERIGDFFTCPKCGKVQMLEYDESYDESVGEEDGFFWFV